MRYQVFICYKHSVPGTDRLTQDYTMAKELYRELKARKITAFFAPESLRIKGEDEWPREIELALGQSDVLMLVATDPSYVTSPELLREWPVFLRMITEEKRNKRLFLFQDGKFDLPESLQRRQTFFYDRTDEQIKSVGDYLENAIASIGRENREAAEVGASEARSAEEHDLLAPYRSLSDAEQREFLEDFFAWYSSFHVLRNRDGDQPLTAELPSRFLAELLAPPAYGQRGMLLKITGPNGTGKSILLQLLHLILQTDDSYKSRVHARYLDLLRYYDVICRDPERAEQQIFSEIDRAIGDLVRRAEEDGRIPVLFVVGLNNCNYGSVSPDFCLYRALERYRRHRIRIVVSIDDYSEQASDRISENPFERFNYKYEVRSVSLPAYQRDSVGREVRAYLRFLEKYHDYPVDGDLEQRICDFIFKNSVYSLDHFVLDLILQRSGDGHTSFFSAVESFCNDSFYGNQHKKDFFAERAFDFTYGGGHFDDHRGMDNSHVIQVFRHGVVIQYLISYYYLKRFSELDLTCGDISFFEQILPKEITRFLMPMINASEELEEKIIRFCEMRHKDMTHLCQSEMHYCLGRIRNKRFKERADALLKRLYAEYKSEFKRALNERMPLDLLKQKAFLYRSLAVSLIYRGYGSVTREYLQLLISDEISNRINRGFHLEYYGDKPFMPRLDSLDVADVPAVGEKTISALLQSLCDLRVTDGMTPTGELSFFTFCSLLQVRMESCEFPRARLVYYIRRCLEIFPTYLRGSSAARDDRIGAYYMMVREDFEEFLSKEATDPHGGLPMLNGLFASLSSLGELDRAGWKKYGIPFPESVSEHMYHCWLLGALYLPDSYDAEGYSKESILRMLLIHDWAESITGDINKPRKTREDYQHERQLMRMLLLKGTYPSVSDLSGYFDVWEEMESSGRRSENARIAKDIDCIQALYQFCCYHVRYPEKFPEGVNEEWFDLYYNELKSSLGRELFRRLILDQPAFESVIPRVYKK